MIERMIRAARLEAALYEEVEHDTSATGQAMLVVVISSVAAGIGAIGLVGIEGLLMGIVGALLGWLALSAVTHFIGVTILKTPHTEATWGQLLRTIGLAQSPGVLAILAFIPLVGPLIALLVLIWVLVAVVVAVRQALDYTSTLRAVAVVFLAWVVMLGIRALLLLPFR